MKSIITTILLFTALLSGGVRHDGRKLDHRPPAL